MAETTCVTNYIYSSNNSTSGSVSIIDAGNSFPNSQAVPETKSRHASSGNGKIERAVYAHIRAVRALGRTRINTSEIADALSLKVSEVHRAVERLKNKGVRGI